MANQDASEPLVQIPIDGYKTVSLRDLNEVHQFVVTEEQIWNWAFGLREANPMRDWLMPAYNKMQTIRTIVDKCRKSSDTASLTSLRNELSSAFRANGPCIHSLSPLGKFILEQKDRVGSHNAANAALTVLQPATNSLGTPVGAALGVLYLHGCLSNTFLGELKQLSEDLHLRMQGNATEWEKLKDQIAGDRAASKAEVDNAINAATDRLKAAEERWREIKEFEEPSGYWRKKAIAHWLYSLGWLFLTLVSGSLGGFGVCFLADKYISQAIAKSPTNESAAGLFMHWRDSLPHLLPVVLSAVGLYWVLRIFVRNYISHQHLKTDAEERVVLAKTYLALRERDKDRALEKEERVIVLNQLFRHAQSGMVKDDAAPQIPLSLLTKI